MSIPEKNSTANLFRFITAHNVFFPQFIQTQLLAIPIPIPIPALYRQTILPSFYTIISNQKVISDNSKKFQNSNLNVVKLLKILCIQLRLQADPLDTSDLNSTSALFSETRSEASKSIGPTINGGKECSVPIEYRGKTKF